MAPRLGLPSFFLFTPFAYHLSIPPFDPAHLGGDWVLALAPFLKAGARFDIGKSQIKKEDSVYYWISSLVIA
jgi:hypothetical protein